MKIQISASIPTEMGLWAKERGIGISHFLQAKLKEEMQKGNAEKNAELVEIAKLRKRIESLKVRLDFALDFIDKKGFWGDYDTVWTAYDIAQHQEEGN